MRIINARVFPVDRPVIENGYVDIEAGRIRAVGAMPPPGEAEEILDAGHEIRFLEGDGILADQEKVPEKFFCGLKFYHGDIRVRSRAGEIRDHICASRGDARENGSMAVFVGGRDDGEGIFCGKRAV